MITVRVDLCPSLTNATLGNRSPATQEGNQNFLEPKQRRGEIRRRFGRKRVHVGEGDRRDFVLVDEAGGIHSVGIKVADIRAKINDLDREKLLTVEQTREQQINRALNRSEQRSLENPEKQYEKFLEPTAKRP